MLVRALKYFHVILILSCGLLLPVEVWAGKPAPDPRGQVPYSSSPTVSAGQAHMEDVDKQADIDVYLKGASGAPLDASAVVTLTKLDGVFVDQKTAKNGYARFNGVHATEYRIQVLAPKYEATARQLEVQERSLAKITIEMTPQSAEEAASSVGLYALAPKTQREVGKALEELRANKPNDARKHLEAAQKAAPTSAEIAYLFGVYSSQVNDPVQARAYWMKTLELNPKHLSALLAVGQDLLQENKSTEALPYLTRAAEAEPSSWRAHALLAEGLVLQHQNDEAVKQAERAIQLGHERAAVVQPVLARALAARGDREEATKVLQAYVQTHPADVAASKDLETLRNPQIADASSDAAAAASEMAAMNKDATALPMASKWMP